MLDDREAEAGAPLLARPPLVDPVEALEDPRQRVGGDADAGVRDLRARTSPPRPAGAGQGRTATGRPRRLYLTALSSRLVARRSRLSRSPWTGGTGSAGTSSRTVHRAAPGRLLHDLDRAPEDRQQVDRLGARALVLQAFEARQGQEVVEERLEAAALVEDPATKRSAAGRSSIAPSRRVSA